MSNARSRHRNAKVGSNPNSVGTTYSEHSYWRCFLVEDTGAPSSPPRLPFFWPTTLPGVAATAPGTFALGVGAGDADTCALGVFAAGEAWAFTADLRPAATGAAAAGDATLGAVFGTGVVAATETTFPFTADAWLAGTGGAGAPGFTDDLGGLGAGVLTPTDGVAAEAPFLVVDPGALVAGVVGGRAGAATVWSAPAMPPPPLPFFPAVGVAAAAVGAGAGVEAAGVAWAPPPFPFFPGVGVAAAAAVGAGAASDAAGAGTAAGWAPPTFPFLADGGCAATAEGSDVAAAENGTAAAAAAAVTDPLPFFPLADTAALGVAPSCCLTFFAVEGVVTGPGVLGAGSADGVASLAAAPENKGTQRGRRSHCAGQQNACRVI
jgi:hypothetical protein